mmetsp:Transcript_22705/g.47900  ORF Transcript_22705/g.47900 Transcript_22705/m.47900 type:complete len:338 (+) Transcript_22705:5066-6079(+)
MGNGRLMRILSWLRSIRIQLNMLMKSVGRQSIGLRNGRRRMVVIVGIIGRSPSRTSMMMFKQNGTGAISFIPIRFGILTVVKVLQGRWTIPLTGIPLLRGMSGSPGNTRRSNGRGQNGFASLHARVHQTSRSTRGEGVVLNRRRRCISRVPAVGKSIHRSGRIATMMGDTTKRRIQRLVIPPQLPYQLHLLRSHPFEVIAGRRVDDSIVVARGGSRGGSVGTRSSGGIRSKSVRSGGGTRSGGIPVRARGLVPDQDVDILPSEIVGVSAVAGVVAVGLFQIVHGQTAAHASLAQSGAAHDGENGSHDVGVVVVHGQEVIGEGVGCFSWGHLEQNKSI